MATCKIVAYLFSMALGYWVLTLAEKEKGNNKKIGKVIGWVILVVSLAGPFCLAASGLYCHSREGACYSSGGCPWSGHGTMGDPEDLGKKK